MNTLRNLGVAVTIACGLAASAASATVVLDFTGVSTQTTNDHITTAVGGFYDGGVSGGGTSGPNFGVTVGSNAAVVNYYNGCCEPQSSSGEKGVMVILPDKFGDSITMFNVPAGFGTLLEFDFAAYCFTYVEIRSGVNGTGSILSSGSFNRDNGPDVPCAPDATGAYCEWQTAYIPFAGTARSFFLFEGAPSSALYDRVTLGDAPVEGVPEPEAWEMLIVGFGMAGACVRRRSAAPSPAA